MIALCEHKDCDTGLGISDALGGCIRAELPGVLNAGHAAPSELMPAESGAAPLFWETSDVAGSRPAATFSGRWLLLPGSLIA